MANESDGGRQWVVDPPPGPGEVSLYLAGGEGADLSPDQEAALSELLRTLESSDAEVVGHSKDCPKLSECLDLSCGKVSCYPLQCSSLVRAAGAGTTSSTTSWSLMGSFGPGAA